MRLMREMRKFIIYCIVGGIATGMHYVVMVALIKWGGMTEIAATCIGYTSGAIVKYPLNHGLVFDSDEPHRQAIPKFVAACVIGFLMNAVVFAALFQVFPKYYMIAQVLTTGIVLFVNYLLARYWIFFTRGAAKKSA
jgi:putative flippase GtrA